MTETKTRIEKEEKEVDERVSERKPTAVDICLSGSK